MGVQAGVGDAGLGLVDALVLQALGFPALAVDVAQLCPALPAWQAAEQGRRRRCLQLLENARSVCSSLLLPWVLEESIQHVA